MADDRLDRVNRVSTSETQIHPTISTLLVKSLCWVTKPRRAVITEVLPRCEGAEFTAFEVNTFRARYVQVAYPEEVPVICAEHLVVEYYSR